MRTKNLLLASAMLIGLMPAAALANPVVDTAPAAETAAPAPAEEAQPTQDSDGLTEIVVTATKRETNLQKTPISMAVMNDEDIKKRHVQSMLDLADGAIPSLRVATFESRQSALTVGMRGIVPGDANQPAREQGVGVYIDGIYLGRQHGLNAGLLDVERIEVLKGPQGTLFGRNTEGGAVNIISRAPTGEFGGRASVGMGNYGSYNGQIHVDMPEFAGVSFKLDAAIQHQDATTKNPMDGQEGWNSFHRYGGRLSARIRPFEGFTADFAVDVGRDENTPIYSQLINYNPLGLPVGRYVGTVLTAPNGVRCGTNNPCIAPLPSIVGVHPDRQKVADIGVPQQPSVGETFGVSSIMKWKVAPSLELRSITAWRTVSDEQWDNSGGANRTPAFVPNGTFSRYSLSKLDQRQFSQEFQAVGGVSDIDYVLGLYYFNERANDEAKTPNTNRWNADGTAYTIVDPLTYPLATVARASIAYAKSYAAYGQATWTPSSFDNFHLTLGGRWTNDRKNGHLYTVNGAPSAFTFRQKNSRFDPLITLAMEPTDGVHVYAKYATGYRAGGASSRSLDYRAFGPESVRSYEMGIKTELFDRKVRFNLAGYMMDRKDSQVDFNFYLLQPNGTVRNTLETVNAEGTTKIRGIEADLTIRPVEGLSLGASYAYTHAKIPLARNTVQEAENAKRNPPILGEVWQRVFIVYTPKHALSGSLDYDVPIGSNGTAFKLHLDANYSGPAYSFDNENVKTEKSFIVNGRLAIADIPMTQGGSSLTLSAWARNLLNESHIYRRSNANNAVLGDYANFNAPRTFGVEASLKF